MLVYNELIVPWVHYILLQISELLGQDAALSIALKDVANDAERTFFDILKARGDKILRYPPPIAVDLSPPLAVAEGISAWLELFNTYSEMMVPSGGQKPDFQPVLSALLDPIIQVYCELMPRLLSYMMCM